VKPNRITLVSDPHSVLRYDFSDGGFCHTDSLVDLILRLSRFVHFDNRFTKGIDLLQKLFLSGLHSFLGLFCGPNSTNPRSTNRPSVFFGKFLAGVRLTKGHSGFRAQSFSYVGFSDFFNHLGSERVSPVSTECRIGKIFSQVSKISDMIPFSFSPVVFRTFFYFFYGWFQLQIFELVNPINLVAWLFRLGVHVLSQPSSQLGLRFPNITDPAAPGIS
jgi:hypothetical protein